MHPKPIEPLKCGHTKPCRFEKDKLCYSPNYCVFQLALDQGQRIEKHLKGLIKRRDWLEKELQYMNKIIKDLER